MNKALFFSTGRWRCIQCSFFYRPQITLYTTVHSAHAWCRSFIFTRCSNSSSRSINLVRALMDRGFRRLDLDELFRFEAHEELLIQELQSTSIRNTCNQKLMLSKRDAILHSLLFLKLLRCFLQLTTSRFYCSKTIFFIKRRRRYAFEP